MTNDLLTDLGAAHLYTPFRSSLFNAMDKVRLANRTGGSVVTGDVLCIDTAHDMSFIAASSAYPYRTCYVVPEDIDALGAGATKTILDTEYGWVYRPGAGVPLASVDGAVDIGEYLVFSATAKKFAGTDLTTATSYPPHHAKAIALAAIGVAGQIPVLLLEESANPYMACSVYNNADIAITASTVTALTFNTEIFDPAGLHSTVTNTSRLTVPADQVGTMPWKIIGGIEWSAVPAAGSYMAIRIGGTNSVARSENQGYAPAAWGLSTVYNLAAGEYVELVVYTVTAGLSVKYYSLYSPVFSMVRMGS